MPPEPDSSWQDNQDIFDGTPHSLTSHTALDQEAPPNSLHHYHQQQHQQQLSRLSRHTPSQPLPPVLPASSTARASQPLPPLPPLRLLDAGIATATAAVATEQEPQLRPSSSAARPANWRRSLQTPSSITSLISTLDEIGRSLDDANTHLRTLLDRTIAVDLSPASQIPRSSTTGMSSRPGGVAGSRRESSRSEEGSRMTKRRRLDSADRNVAPAFKGFRYGRYGQVEPGKLTMEIVSCDGGLYSDGGSYAAENILKSDNSVYCTKGNRCNIVLQHQGCTTFSLKELIIKAPGRNYSSPVREGLVFFSMTKDELLSTNQFHADDMAPPAPPVPPAPPTHSSSASTLNTLRLYTTARMTAERLADVLNTNDDLDDADNDPRGGTTNDLYDFITSGYSDEAPFQTRRDLGASSHFQVMTECSDDENDEAPGRGGGGGGAGSGRGPHRGGRQQGASGWSPTPLRSRLRRRLPVLDESSPYGAHLNTWDAGADVFEEDDDDDQYTEFVDLHDPTAAFFPDSPRGDLRRIEGRARLGLGGQQNIRPDEGGQDRDEDDEDDDDDDENEDELEDDDDEDDDDGRSPYAQFSSTPYENSSGSGNSSGAGVIMPSAKFHIANNRTRCTIRFNPPVTARYILLKMWNPRQDIAGNIDIQGVVAKGFAGPRYFPSLELR